MQNRNIAVVFFCSIIFFSAMKSHADSGLAEQINLWTHRLIKTSKVWNAEIFGGNVVIGLIGSGMDTDHFQTINQVFTNYSEDPTNGIDDDQNGFIDDIHGWNFLDQKNQVSKGNGKSTEMMGVIASNHCAGPIRGLAPYAQIIPLQVGGLENRSEENIIAATEYALMMGAQVILFEENVDVKSAGLRNLFQRLADKNVMVVVPAKDITTDPSNRQSNYHLQRNYPRHVDSKPVNTVIVGATNSLDQYSVFAMSGIDVDLAAPGEKVWTTVNMENPEPIAPRSHSGIAAAHVAGALALLISSEPNLTAEQMKERLMKGIDPGSFPVKSQGRLNLAKLLKL